MIFDKQKVIVDFDVNKFFQLPYISLPLSGFFNPFATCCFLNDNQVFCQFFSVRKKDGFWHQHFVYDIDKWTTTCPLEKYKYEDCTKKNFP